MIIRCFCFIAVLALAGCAETPLDSTAAVFDLRGVPLSPELEPALVKSRAALGQPDPPTRAAREIEEQYRLRLGIQRAATRQAAGDSLFAYWRRAPENFLWITLALRYEHLLQRPDDFAALRAHPAYADTASPVGAFFQASDRYSYGSRGEHYRRAAARAAQLDSLQRAMLGLQIAWIDSDCGEGLAAVGRLLTELDAARELGGSRVELRFWQFICPILMREDRLDDALHVAHHGLALARKTGNLYREVEMAIQYADVLRARREHEAVFVLLDDCIARCMENDLPWLLAKSMDMVATLCSDLGQVERALAYDRRNLAHNIAVADVMNIPRSLINMADDFRLLGELDSCRVYQLRARAHVEQHADTRNAALLPLFEAEYYLQVGDYAVADSLLRLALGRSKDASLITDEARRLLKLIQQGLEMGQPDLAYHAIERLRSLRGSLQGHRSDSNLQAEYEIATADFLAAQGEFRLAKEALDRAREAVLSAGGEEQSWAYHCSLGRLALLRQDRASARTAFAQCLALAEQAANPERLATSRFHLGHILVEEGHYAQARKLFDQDVLAAAYGGRFRTRMSTLIFLGITRARQGEHEEALSHYRRAESLCTARSPYDIVARLRIEMGRSLAALDQPRAARDQLRRARELLRFAGAAAEVTELQAFNEDARRDVTEVLVGLYADHPDLIGGGSLGRHTLDIVEEMRSERHAPVGDALIPEAGALLAYFIGRDRSFLWAGADGTITIHPLPGRAQLRARLIPLLADLSRPRRSIDPTDLAAMSEVLLGPLRPHWKAHTTLRVIPDDLLFSVPWGALMLGAIQVVDHGPLIEAPCLAVVSRKTSRDPRTLKLLALGSDGTVNSGDGADSEKLRYAEEEARAIVSMWPSPKSTLRLGGEATWDRIRIAGLDTYGIIHIASHAVVHQGLPSRASLRLAGGTAHETPLTIAAVQKLELHTELIYLSCCEAAKRHGRRSGLMDFARAFLGAGTRAVIASPLRIDDEAARYLAEHFYRHWLDGASMAEALQAAQRDVRAAKPLWQHPYFWGFHRLIGHAG